MTAEPTMIERVAARMYDWEAEINGLPQRWAAVPPRARKEWYLMARAVIEAMREPTEEMFKAGDDCGDYDPDHGWTPADNSTIWRAMIDEAAKG